MPRPTHLSTPTADLAVIDFSITMVIINSAADNFRPSISRDIHLRFILLAHIIFVKEQLPWLVMFLRQDNCSLQMRRYTTGIERALAAFLPGVSSVPYYPENERVHVAVPVTRFTTPQTTHPSAPADDSPTRAGLQRRG